MAESEKARSKRLLDAFKLTVAKWQKLDDYQKGLCFICGKKQKSGKRLSTDHDHKTGEVRGLLCAWCNRLLGKIERFWDIAAIIRLLRYLEYPPAREALGYIHYGYKGNVHTKKHRRLLKRERRNDKAK